MKPNPEVAEMVKSALIAGGFDGLFNMDGGCACLVGDLSPGNCLSENCEAGFKKEYPDRKCGGSDCDGECDFHVQRKKP